MDFIVEAQELSQETKAELKSMSNVRELAEEEKNDGRKKKRQAIGGLIIFTLVFAYALISGAITWITTGNMDIFLLFFIFYIGCVIGMLLLIFFDKYNLKRYKKVFVIKGYIRNVIYYRGMTMNFIYYDFENNTYRTAVCRGEMLEKNKRNAQIGDLVDVLAVEKKNGIRLLCLKPDTIRETI